MVGSPATNRLNYGTINIEVTLADLLQNITGYEFG
jgi:hypothetical protein